MRDNKQNFHFKKNVIMQSENRILGNQLVVMSREDLDALVNEMAQNIVAHSNLLCIDIDKKDNMDVDWFDDLKHEWHNIPQILYAGRSIRGKGWFAIFRIAYPDKHEDQFEALKHDFANSGLIIDKACKNVNRMRFISYDPEPYVNEDATLYTKVWVEPKPAYHSSCAYSGDDITATYDDWFHWVQPWHHLVNADVVCSIWSVRKMRSTKHLRQTKSSTIFCAMSAISRSVRSSISVHSMESTGRRTGYESGNYEFQQLIKGAKIE